MSANLKKSVPIALVHLAGPWLSFLPGLALWFGAWDQDKLLLRHGRAACRFQLAVLLALLLAAPGYNGNIVGMFIGLHGGAIKSWLATWPQSPITSVWTFICSVAIYLLWLGSLVLSLLSAALAMLSREPLYPRWWAVPWGLQT